MRRSWQFCTITRLPFSPRATDADGKAVICFDERRSRLWISGRNFARRGRTGVCRSKLSREPSKTAAGARCHRAKRCRGPSTTSLRPRVRPRLRARGRAESRPDGARLLRPVRAAVRFRTRAASGRQEDSGASLRGLELEPRRRGRARDRRARGGRHASRPRRQGRTGTRPALVGTSGGSAPTTASGDSAAPVPARAAQRPAPPAPPPAHPLTILIQTSGPCGSARRLMTVAVVSAAPTRRTGDARSRQADHAPRRQRGRADLDGQWSHRRNVRGGGRSENRYDHSGKRFNYPLIDLTGVSAALVSADVRWRARMRWSAWSAWSA